MNGEQSYLNSGLTRALNYLNPGLNDLNAIISYYIKVKIKPVR